MHQNKDKKSGTPTGDKRGKTSSRDISHDVKDKIKSHIESFPKIVSHYNRANTKKTYLDSGLNLQIMHDFYFQKCRENNEKPVKNFI